MYFLTVIAFAAIPFLVGAIPVSQKSTRTPGRADLQKLQAGQRHTMARLDRALSAYERNTGKAHPLALKRGHSIRNERRNTFILPLQSFSEVQYTGVIAVGTSPNGTSSEVLTAEFSTGSADMWVGGPTCQACRCNGHKIYDVSFSTTGKNLSSNATVKFGENNVHGNVVSDTVFLGLGNSSHDLQAVNQTILVATDVDPAFQCQTYEAEGMVGLGFKEASELGANSIFDTLSNDPNGLIITGGLAFAFTFSQEGAELVFGGSDFNKFVPPLDFFNLVIPGLWQVQLAAISINGQATNVNQDIIIDSGSLFVYGDLATISEIYGNIPNSAQIANSSQWTIPCETNVNMTVTFGNNIYQISASSYILGPAPNTDPNADLCMGVFATAPEDTSWIMGNAFMRDLFILFDRSNRRVGIAPTSDAIFVKGGALGGALGGA